MAIKIKFASKADAKAFSQSLKGQTKVQKKATVAERIRQQKKTELMAILGADYVPPVYTAPVQTSTTGYVWDQNRGWVLPAPTGPIEMSQLQTSAPATPMIVPSGGAMIPANQLPETYYQQQRVMNVAVAQALPFPPGSQINTETTGGMMVGTGQGVYPPSDVGEISIYDETPIEDAPTASDMQMELGREEAVFEEEDNAFSNIPNRMRVESHEPLDPFGADPSSPSKSTSFFDTVTNLFKTGSETYSTIRGKSPTQLAARYAKPAAPASVYYPPSPASAGMPTWAWIAIGIGALMLLGGAGIFAGKKR